MLTINAVVPAAKADSSRGVWLNACLTCVTERCDMAEV